MQRPLIIPENFAIPRVPRSDLFVIEPLDLRHNESDRAAWTSSIEHIKATPGFAGRSWPDRPMSLAENAADIARHAQDFADRTGFTYTVLDPMSGEVIGCIYFYPPRRDGYDVDVRSWVRADHADLDKPLYDLVRRWLAEEWPFQRPDYAERLQPATAANGTPAPGGSQPKPCLSQTAELAPDLGVLTGHPMDLTCMNGRQRTRPTSGTRLRIRRPG